MVVVYGKIDGTAGKIDSIYRTSWYAWAYDAGSRLLIVDQGTDHMRDETWWSGGAGAAEIQYAVVKIRMHTEGYSTRLHVRLGVVGTE